MKAREIKKKIRGIVDFYADPRLSDAGIIYTMGKVYIYHAVEEISNYREFKKTFKQAVSKISGESENELINCQFARIYEDENEVLFGYYPSGSIEFLHIHESNVIFLEAK